VQFKSLSAESVVKSNVEQQEVSFSPCRIETVLKFQPAIAALWQSLDVLLKNTDKDKGIKQEDVLDIAGNRISRLDTTALDAEVVALRSKERKGAIDSLMKALMSEDTKGALGAMILDSLRNDKDAIEALKKGGLDVADAGKFFSNLPMTMVPELVKGMWAANKEAFGPLAGKVATAAAAAAERVQSKVASLNQEDASQNPSPAIDESPSSSDNSKTM
jgi:hypothetical protein